MVNSATGMIDGIRRKARQGRARCELAVKQNLPDREHQMALDHMTRFGLIADLSQAPNPRSNRKASNKPDTTRSDHDFTAIAMIGGI
jgi:hypothetical protein